MKTHVNIHKIALSPSARFIINILLYMSINAFSPLFFEKHTSNRVSGRTW
jgi:hypothetical protein